MRARRATGRCGCSKLVSHASRTGRCIRSKQLGVFCERARGGLPQDAAAALFWYRKAADQGYPWAQLNLGCFYMEGRGGLSNDDCEAARLYKLAADQGNADAQYNLGVFSERARGGLPQDDAAALFWYRKAADQGHPWAQHNVGVFHELGRGNLPKDDCEAAPFISSPPIKAMPLLNAASGSFTSAGMVGS